MTFSAWNRKTHYWIAIICALPVLIILLTGILLHGKKLSPWIQPIEQRGGKGDPRVSFDTILANCRAAAPEHVKEWADISRVDVRPKRGLIKVTTQDSWEIQLDAVSGRVLQTAYRRSDLIEALHDGSWFNDVVRYFVFLPSGVLLLALWLTGIYLFFLPIYVRWRKRRNLAAKEALAAAGGARQAGD